MRRSTGFFNSIIFLENRPYLTALRYIYSVEVFNTVSDLIQRFW